MGPSRAGKSNLFSRQDTNATTDHSWRARSSTVEREPEDPVKRLYVPHKLFGIPRSDVFYSKNSSARTDSSWRDSSSTQGGNREDRGEHGLPLYLSRSFGKSNEFRSALTDIFRRVTPPKRQRVPENYKPALYVSSILQNN